jgi:hypothetical protein
MAEKTPEQKKHEEEQKKREEQHKAASKDTGSQRGGATVPGAMGTYGSSHSASAAPQPVRQEDHVFTHDEIKGLVGDIQRGELAHIELDEEGTPTGAAFREIPQADQVVAPVAGTPMVQFDDLVTPSGAPITKHMNPETARWDAGMLARNPPPEGGRPGDKPKGPIGGGVVNQPVSA